MASSPFRSAFLPAAGKALLICSLVIVSSTQLFAQSDNRVVNPNYQQAELYSSNYLRQFVYDTSVRPNWIGETDQFWYSFRNSNGTHYVRVNPERGTRDPLFDRVKLSSQLSEAIRKPLDPAQLSLSRAEMNDEGTELKFVSENIQFKYVFATEKLENLGTPEREAAPAGFDPNMSREEMIRRFQDRQERQEQQDEQQNEQQDGEQDAQSPARERQLRAAHRAFSPDRSAYVFAKGHDLYLVEVPADVLKEALEKQAALEKEEAEKAKLEAEGKVDKKQGVDGKKEDENKDEVKNEEVKKDDVKKEEETETDKQDVEKKDDEKKDSVKDGEEEKQVEKKETEKKDDGSTDKDDAAKRAAERKAARQKREADKKESTEKKSDGTTEKDGESPASLANQDEQEKEVEGKKQDEQEKTGEVKKQDEQEKSGDAKKQDEQEKTGEDKKQDKEEKVVEEKKQDEKKDSTKDSDKTEDSKKKDSTEKGKTSDEKKTESSDEKTDEEGDEPKELPIPDLPVEMDDTAIRLSEDGTEDYGFAGRPARAGGNRQRGGDQGARNESENTIKEDTKTRPSVNWSKDSKTFHVQRRDSRGVEELWVINSLATPRPTLEKYDYPMPGEENIRKSEMYFYRRNAAKLSRIEPKWVDEGYSNIHFSKDETELRFLRRDRLLRNVEICSIKLEDESVNCLLTEGFENANIAPQSVRYLEESGDMIWWSERSGWGHYYLYDAQGKLKNAITSGEFLASEIVDVDETNRTLYFRGSGRETGENVYYNHLYAVQLDGSGLRLMDPGDANHSSILSKTKKYLVDNFSRVDLAPTSVLRSADGTEILKLETSDLSRLEHVGWKMPETFVVKAADGVTDLYGNMWKPFDFDPKKRYPIIAHVYPGPQTEGTQHTFSATNGNQQMAQLGFIVIQVGHRGGSPGRGKAYGSYGYLNLRDYSLADKKAAIEQLAQRYSYIDVQRVGLYGHSGGGFMTAAALLVEPYNDFFKVGVSTAGNHDNNIYNNSWSERYHGLKEVVVKEETGEGKDGESAGDATGQRGRGGEGQRGSGRRGTGIPDYESSDFFYEYEMLNEDDQTDLDRRAGLHWDEMNAGDLPPWLFEQNPQEQDVQEVEKQEVEKQEVEKQEVEKQEVEKQEVEKQEVEKQEQEKQTGGQEERMNRRQRAGSRTRQQEGEKTVTDDKKEEKEEKKEEVVDSDKKDSETKQDGDKEKVDENQDGKSTEEKAKEEAKAKTKFEIRVPTNAELAGNLKGHLLLVHGELDNNVHPANTLRLVDALIKANKRFDMLYLPATRHGFGQYQPYVTQRMYEFFTEHLMDDYQSGADINEKVPLK